MTSYEVVNLRYNFIYPTDNYGYIGDQAAYPVNGTYIRFTNVQVPKGALIASAKINLRAYASRADEISVKIVAVAADNPDAPATASDIHYATKTDSYIEWSPSNWTANTWVETPDISNVIQEIVSREGWESGNAILIHIANNGTVYQAYQAIHMIESSGGLWKAKLDISYTA